MVLPDDVAVAMQDGRVVVPAPNVPRCTLPLPPLLGLLRRLPLPRRIGLLDRLYGSYLSRKGVQWMLTAPGIPWKLDLRDPVNRWLLYGPYEGSAAASWITRWLAPGGLVIDSGANIGQALVYIAPLPGVRVVAFEPLASAGEWLEECVRNAPGFDVRVERKGLFGTNTRLPLKQNGPRSTTRRDWYAGQAFPEGLVEVVRLDDYLEGRGETSVRLWMLNVEGAEIQALTGASRLLDSGKIEAIYGRLGTSEYREIRELLSGLGFTFWVATRTGLRKAPTLPREKAINVIMIKQQT